MRVVILTCYPEMFPGSLGYSVIGNALNNKKFSLEIVNLHNFGIDKRGSVDDEPFGGGPGMVIRADVIEKALNSITFKTDNYCKIFLYRKLSRNIILIIRFIRITLILIYHF